MLTLENPTVLEMRMISKTKPKRAAREKKHKMEVVNLKYPRDLCKGLVAMSARLKKD